MRSPNTTMSSSLVGSITNNRKSSFPRGGRPSLVRHLSTLDGPALLQARSLLQLAITMRVGLESKTHDRKWRKIKVYKDCFLHVDAIEWMTKHLQQLQQEQSNTIVSEATAVVKLNELLDAGYVTHVCNEHRFKQHESAVLFFHFHHDVIETDAQSLLRKTKKIVATKSRELVESINSDKDESPPPVLAHGGFLWESEEESIALLQLAVTRLTSTVNKYSEQLDEAHGKILVMEEAMAALGFAMFVILGVMCTTIMYHVLWIPLKQDGHYVGMAFVLLLSFVAWLPFYPTMAVASSHLKILCKLMKPAQGMEEAFMQDVENETEEDIGHKDSDSTSCNRREAPLRGALVKMKSVMSTKFLDTGSVSARDTSRITMREAWDLPDETTWPHKPVMLCVNTPVCKSLTVRHHGTGPCPIGVPFEFSSDLFEGKCLVRLRDIPHSDNVESDTKYFLGRRRKFQSIVQGRFKKPLQVSDVLTGHEFVRPLQKLPPSWMVRTGTNLIKRLAPGAQIVLHQDQPRALAILAATSQTMSADMPGNEPNIATENDIPEDASLLGGIFCNGTNPISTTTRKRHLSDPKRAERYMYDTESIYTFDFYQQLLDVGSYSLDLGFAKLGLCKNLDGQPIQVMCKTTSGEYLWSFQLWHEDLLKNIDTK